LASCLAKAKATALPIPEEAPVIQTILFFKIHCY